MCRSGTVGIHIRDEMEQAMCGTSTVGQSMPMPNTTAPGKTTQVAGESGKGVAQGGGSTDIASALAEISKQIEALKQILAGNSAVQGTSGGGAASTAESMNGHADAMAGCNMGGGPGGKDSGVGGEHGGHDSTQTGTQTGTEPPPLRGITAKDKHVVVIGGGDTGADCVGNSLREGAKSITQFELLPEPPAKRPDDRTPWPLWPQKFRLSYAMEEARELHVGEQDYSVVTTHFLGDDEGRVHSLHYAQAEPSPPFKPVSGTEGEMRADLVLLAMGFLHPEPYLLDKLEIAKDQRGNAKAVKPYTTSVEGVFAAGDARRGQSLIVWAINEGRQCARMVDRYLGTLDADRAADGDADAGPAAPPQRVGPGVPA
jgi:hypothetical protein